MKPEKTVVRAAEGSRNLDESELRAAFESVHADTPIWQAIQQLLLEALEDQIDHTAALAGNPEHGPLAASAGAMEAIGHFYDGLKKRFEAAHEIQPRGEPVAK